jgi:hypothetical protein
MTPMHNVPNEYVAKAARWFGIGLVITPVFDIADRAGLATAPTQLDASTWWDMAVHGVPWVVIGFVAAWLLRNHAHTDRTWFFFACSSVLLVYLAVSGVGVLAFASVIALAVAFGHLRTAARAISAEVHRPPGPK